MADRVGLSLGLDKCATLGQVWLGKLKKLIHDLEPFEVEGTRLAIMNLQSTYKYLGVVIDTTRPEDLDLVRWGRNLEDLI